MNQSIFPHHQLPTRVPWLERIRETAWNRFKKVGFPTTQDEDWKFTNVQPIAENYYFKNDPKDLIEHPSHPAVKNIKDFSFNGSSSNRIVFLNGCYSPSLSSLTHSLEKARIGTLSELLQNNSKLLESNLCRYADIQNDSFTALNTAHFNDGVVVYLPKGFKISSPIQLVFVCTSYKKMVFHPRVLIIAERESEASIVESYIGMEDREYFTNAVTEIVVSENSAIHHCKVQRESPNAYHVALTQVHQQDHSSFVSHSISLGGALVRNNLNVTLNEGADCTLNGLYIGSGDQLMDNHTTVDHTKPHANSRELYKGILNDRAKAVFNGKILVRQDAQKTDAVQSNRNLLLSNDSTIQTKPELKILANDVKCKHGATVGQIDPNILFYLRSRGMDQEKARDLLVHAFASEMIDKIPIDSIQSSLKAFTLTGKW